MITLARGRKIFDWWGRHDRVYSLLMKIVFMGQEHHLRRVAIASLRLHEGDTVLDVGCGNGRNFPYLMQHVGGSGKIIGIDYSKYMLAKALKIIKDNGWKNITLIHIDAAKITFPPDSIDGVISSCAMSAIPDHENTLKKTMSALKKGKRLVVMDAKLCEGAARHINPIIGPVFHKTTNWDYLKDIIGTVKSLTTSTRVKMYNNGCLYICVARK